MAVVKFPVVAFTKAHHLRSPWAVIFTNRLQALEPVSLEFCNFGFEVFARTQEEAHDEGFKDTNTNISVGTISWKIPANFEPDTTTATHAPIPDPFHPAAYPGPAGPARLATMRQHARTPIPAEFLLLENLDAFRQQRMAAIDTFQWK